MTSPPSPLPAFSRVLPILILALPLSLVPLADTCGGGEPVDSAPVWSNIPTQVAASGASGALELDPYVSDPDTLDGALILWGTGGSGGVSLTIDGGSHVLSYTVTAGFVGSEAFTLFAADPEGNEGTTSLHFSVTAGGAATVRITSPAAGGTYAPEITLRAEASSDITRVAYYAPWGAEDYLLGESTVGSEGFEVDYTFSNAGDREIKAQGFGADGALLASDRISLTIEQDPTPPEDPPPTGGGDAGLGVWLWYVEGTGLTHTQLADRLAGLGVDRIYLKVADGTDLWEDVLQTSVVNIYHARGIEAWGWSYNYPSSYTAQAEALYEAARKGFDGYVLDLEVEFDNRSTEMHSILSAFSDAREDAAAFHGGDFPLYVTTWGNPSDHGMRVDIIDQYVDGHMPQTYLEVWGAPYMANATYWTEYGTQEYRSLGAMGPIHHIVSTEYGDITAAQVSAVFGASGAESSIWRVPGGGTPTSIWQDWEQVQWGMFDGAGASMTFTSPINGGVYLNGIWFKVDAPESVARVSYVADGYPIGESSNREDDFALRYTFNTLGARTVRATGFDAAGGQVAQASVSFTVQSDQTSVISGVPYYYQVNNSINPYGSCQNTSLAMVLSYYGCSLTPDDISAWWGTSYAQTTYGLAEVFNTEAAACGIPQRITPHQDGRMGDVDALLAAGKPVIIHGYFTSYGHVLVLLGKEGDAYVANDPYGRWTEVFKGGYYPSDADDGRYIRYDQGAVELAVASLNGYSFEPIWYHEIR